MTIRAVPRAGRRLPTGLLILLAALLAGCVRADRTTPTAPLQSSLPADEAQAPLVGAPQGSAAIALLLPLGGRASAIGKDMSDAAQLAVFDTDGREVALLPRDTGDAAETAAAAAREAIGEGAELVLGPLFAASTRVVGPVAAEAGKTVLAFSNDASVAGGNVYVLGFRPEEQVQRVVRYAQGRGLARLALAAPEDAYGALAMRAFTSLLGPGAPVVNYPGSGDVAPSLARLAGGTFDAVLIADGGSRLGQAAAALRDGTSAPMLLGTRRWQEDQAILQQPALAGAWIAGIAPPTEAAFKGRFRSVFAREPHELAALAYDATALGVLLARSDRTYGAATLQDPLGFAGTLGAFRLRADGLTEHALAILEVGAGGGLAVIDAAPTAFASDVPTQ